MTMPTQHCPHCQSEISDSTAALGPDKAPQPGDYSICIYCGGYLRFDTNCMLRRLSAEEFLAMPDRDRSALGKMANVIVKFPNKPEGKKRFR